MPSTSAGASPADIAFINAHGTGTRENDRVESVFFHRAFPGVPFGSTKGFTGHTLGAAGAIEAAFTVAALEHGRIPANRGFEHPDPELPAHPVAEATEVHGTDGAVPDTRVRGQQQCVGLHRGGGAMKAFIRGPASSGPSAAGWPAWGKPFAASPLTGADAQKPGGTAANRPARPHDPAPHPAPRGPLRPHGHPGRPSRPRGRRPGQTRRPRTRVWWWPPAWARRPTRWTCRPRTSRWPTSPSRPSCSRTRSRMRPRPTSRCCSGCAAPASRSTSTSWRCRSLFRRRSTGSKRAAPRRSWSAASTVSRRPCTRSIAALPG